MANLRLYADAAKLARMPVVIERVDGLRGGVALGDKTGLDAVIASTKGIVPQLEKLISKEKIHIIYNGVDPGAYDKVAPQRFGFSDNDLIVGRTSRLAGGKNISLLIQAIIELRREAKYQKVRLVICGGDTTQPGSIPMLAKLQKEAQPLGNSVVFAGEVFDTTAITKGYDIATCTSRPNNEGIPNSLMEAMAAGKPVVASKVDDVPELVEHEKTGLLFRDNDSSELVFSLKRLFDNEQERGRMGSQGKQKVMAIFNLETQAKKYSNLYRDLLSHKQ
jgi:glycosyltransferase involved in cell wall biosynthesis